MTGRPGEVRAGADGTTLVFRREYPDPVEDVWAAVTESERLARWIGTWSGEPRPGGTVAFLMTGEADAGGEVATEPMDVTIHVCEPPHRLEVEFPAEGSSQPWRIAVTVSATSSGSVLLFEQRLVEGFATTDVEAGWRWYLDRLGASLAGGPMPDWSDYDPGHAA